jgi:hypothetical protein
MDLSEIKKNKAIRDEKGNLTPEYIDKFVKDSISQNPIVYKRLAEI